jgi:hypothetical protein
MTGDATDAKARQATVPKSGRHGDAHGHILVAHRQLAFSSLDLLDLKAAFGQAHVERRPRALAAVLERIPEIGKARIMIATHGGV